MRDVKSSTTKPPVVRILFVACPIILVIILLLSVSGLIAGLVVALLVDFRKKTTFHFRRPYVPGTSSSVFFFTGIPTTWGDNFSLIQLLDLSLCQTQSLESPTYEFQASSLGGIPFVDVWSQDNALAVYNLAAVPEDVSFEISASCEAGESQFEVEIVLLGRGTKMDQVESFEHFGDYYEGLRQFAVRMEAENGIQTSRAPEWAFGPSWETYGFEEDFDVSTITALVPTLKKYFIRSVTIDSGWYGHGRGEACVFETGDFQVNPDTIGTEQDFSDLVTLLHSEGFKVRAWWIPGVSEEDTVLHEQHDDWFLMPVVSSTTDTSDVYLDPQNPEVVQWNEALVARFRSYGLDGFKQDDIYQFGSFDEAELSAYFDLVNGILPTDDPYFVVNTCNCGIQQNIFQFPGQNALITSDPVGSKQFRHRAKYLHALNINGAAILGDHVELTLGDVGGAEMDVPGFYDDVDFTSIVPLGMVLQTKFRSDPGGTLYLKWFTIYNEERFYAMEWINIPISGIPPEMYLMRNQTTNERFFTLFASEEGGEFDGQVTLPHLDPGRGYDLYDIAADSSCGTCVANGDGECSSVSLNFDHSAVIRVSEQ